ncbi:MAG: transposase [Desulfobacteraceae bacterium]|nr:transposase [Desulfobacteraceae bacterium]
MIDQQTREAVKQMRIRGVSISEIARILMIDRKTVRSVINGYHGGQEMKTSRYEEHLPIIRELFTQCRGNVSRVRDLLRETHGISIPYASLTWLVRHHGIRKPVKKQAGIYVFEPGREMQHDTSPFKIHLGQKKVTTQCAALILAYSRKLFIQFYNRFTRFEAGVFLTDAFRYMDGTCQRCTIDNTSVLVVRGAGPDAEIAPQIKRLGNIFGVQFVPHHVRHPDRKARVENAFGYVMKNFLSGREFANWPDLNEQALQWCETVANKRSKRSLGMSADQAWLAEKPFLTPVPDYVPPVYQSFYRVVDTQGYVSLDTNRYSVPYKLIGEKVEVQKHLAKVLVYCGNRIMAEHERDIEHRDKRITNASHRSPRLTKKASGSATKEEKILLGESEMLDNYVLELKKRSHGRGMVKLRRLLELKRTYPKQAFYKAVKRALEYGLYDLARLEKIILTLIAGEYFKL